MLRLDRVKPTVLPNSLPACVFKVALLPVSAKAAPACMTPVALLVIAKDKAPASVERFCVASNLPVLSKVLVTFSVRSCADCIVPLLLSETRLNVPELPAVFEAMNAPELLRLVALNVVPLLAHIYR